LIRNVRRWQAENPIRLADQPYCRQVRYGVLYLIAGISLVLSVAPRDDPVNGMLGWFVVLLWIIVISATWLLYRQRCLQPTTTP
jgi:hypothetical protein